MSFLSSIKDKAALEETFDKRLRREVAGVLRMPAEMSLVDWADEYRYLPNNSAEKGKWRSARMRVAIEPMEAVTDETTRKITVMTPTQMLKTELLINTSFYFIHHDPAPIMFVLPTAEQARMISVERFQKSLDATPVMAELAEVYGGKGNTMMQKNFINTVTFSSARNPGHLASRSVRIVLADEVDKYPRSAGTEGDPLMIVIERTEWFSGYEKIIMTCSPTIKGLSRIEESYEQSDQRIYMHHCPKCGHEFAPEFARNVWWPGMDSSGKKDKPRDARMICSGCDAPWTEGERIQSINRGLYIKQNPDVIDHAGFNMTRMSSPFPVIPKMAQKFIEAGNDQNKLMVFRNTQEGRSYQVRGMAIEWRTLYDRRESYTIGIVPRSVIKIVMGIDVQAGCIYYETLGIGMYMESWSIDANVKLGEVTDQTFVAKLIQWLREKLVDHTGYQWSYDMINIDSGYATTAVNEMVTQMQAAGLPARAVQGKGRGSQIIAPPKPTQISIEGKQRKSSIKMWQVNSDILKETIFGYYGLVGPTEKEQESGTPFPPGYQHMPEYDDNYFKQITAEIREESQDPKGRPKFDWVPIRKENHWLDCKVYAFAGAYMLGLDSWKAERWHGEYKTRRGQPKEAKPNQSNKALTPQPKVVKRDGLPRISRP